MPTGFFAKSCAVWSYKLTEEAALFLFLLMPQGTKCTFEHWPGFCI